MPSRTIHILLFIYLFLGTLMSIGCANADSITERNGFRVQPPRVFVKQNFLVLDNERPIFADINLASDAISDFILQLSHINKGQPVPAGGLRAASPESLAELRVPSHVIAHNGNYIYDFIYCWRKPNENRLEFLVDWHTPGVKELYTDSYVFRKIGADWFFESHGSTKPFSWTTNDRAPRKCPGH